jgi:hypothetical protein
MKSVKGKRRPEKCTSELSSLAMRLVNFQGTFSINLILTSFVSLGLKGKMFAKKRHAENALMKKTIAMHEERDNKHKAEDGVPQNAVPAYLLEREQVRSPA